MCSVDVLVASYGDYKWRLMAENAAVDARHHSGADKVTHYHGTSLAEARNHLVQQSRADYIVLLDADDRLATNYVNTFKDLYLDTDLDLLYKPATLGWYPDGTYDEEVGMIRSDNLARRNEMVIGTIFKRDNFLGFDTTLDSLEDWDLFIRMYKAGARIRECPEMVYIVGVHPSSRNKKIGGSTYGKIIEKNNLRNVSIKPERL